MQAVVETQTPLEKIRRAEELQTAITQLIDTEKDSYPVLYEEKVDGEYKGVIHIANPHQDYPRDIVSLPTRATREEVEETRAKIKPYIETAINLQAIAETYRDRQMLMLEGGTSIGKTFAVEKFTEFLYGRNAKLVDFYCNGQTDTAQLTGKYVPTAEDKESLSKINAFLFSDTGAEFIKSLKTKGQISENSTFNEKQRWAAIHLGISINDRTFSFSYGSMAQAALGTLMENGNVQIKEDGTGNGLILHIQEVGLAKPEVVNALLALRGKNGRLTESFQLWDNGGRVINLGPETYVVFSTNPVDGTYQSRNDVDPALSRNLRWVRLGEISSATIEQAAPHFLCYQVDNASPKDRSHAIIDLTQHKEIGKKLAEVLVSFHESFCDLVKDGAAGGDRQKIPVTLDTLAQVATYMLTSQVVKNGTVDLAETFIRAVDKIYLGRIKDPALIKNLSKKLKIKLTGKFTDPESGKTETFTETKEPESGETKTFTETKEFEGELKTCEEIINILTKRILFPEQAALDKSKNADKMHSEFLTSLIDKLKIKIVKINEKRERLDLMKGLANQADDLGLSREDIELILNELADLSPSKEVFGKKPRRAWRKEIKEYKEMLFGG